MEVITAYIHQDRDLLIEQIESINPDFIISCGVMEPLIWLLDLEVDPEKTRGKPIKDKSGKFWIAPFRHPVRASGEKIYNDLKKFFAKIN
ncbi:MAG: hypothetical protein P9L96_06905 [Candidatus Gygaella obscura]|nr:hypothetical protein [Candidatus Gygaella obscura]